MTPQISAFRLPDHISAKRDPALIGEDEIHFAALAASLDRSIAQLQERLDHLRRAPGGSGQRALERDLEIHQSTARMRVLRRCGLDLCLGRMVNEDSGDITYIGRLGLSDHDGRRLLVDWRSPAAEPFFGATLARPMGIASRRRYRWSRGRITDYWDEAFSADGFESSTALDDQSSFIASLGSSRSNRMRDVLGTIQADQDAIIRAGSRGCLVVDGGPGTGKTVVALHRAAYLLYADPRVQRERGGVLVVGPSHGYLAYIDDVLPGLGEDGVQVCTLADLVPGGDSAVPEVDRRVAVLKSSARLVDAVDAAVRHYERPPRHESLITTPWTDVSLEADDWSDAFSAAHAAVPHNDARAELWEEVVQIVARRHRDDVPLRHLRHTLEQDDELRAAVARAWPLLDPFGVIADLWSVPAYLRACAPWLSEEQIRLLQRPDARAWTREDLPLLDAARLRIGDPRAARRSRQRRIALAAEREQMDRVVESLIESDDSELQLMSMLRGQDAQNSLEHEFADPTPDPDLLAGPFQHIVVDEAQELTDAQWLMLLARCPSRSFTIVGDRAQARHGFVGSWPERLGSVGLDAVSVASLTINYRTPEEVMMVAAPVIRAVVPDASVPTSVRRNGIPVLREPLSRLAGILTEWLASHGEGIAAVIARDPSALIPTDGEVPGEERVRYLTPELAKGLEFDLVVIVGDPDQDEGTIEGAVDRYVAMTRATRQLVIVTK